MSCAVARLLRNKSVRALCRLFLYSNLLVILVLFVYFREVYAIDLRSNCPKINVLGSILNNIPYDSMFPINIGGQTVGGGENMTPRRSAKSFQCKCKNNLGIDEYGMTLGMWEVAYLIELTREPNCFIALNGTSIYLNGSENFGSSGIGRYDAEDLSFYHVHVYSFPLFTMLNLYSDIKCGTNDYLDMELLYASELDPLWNNELKTLKFYPETKLYATKEAVESCTIDAQLSLSGQELSNELQHCAGTWGQIYPLTGYVGGSSVARKTSLLATRILKLLHMRGLLKDTVGESNMCKASNSFTLDKDMYRFSMVYPISETTSTHAIGEDVELWKGDSRIVPGTHNVIYAVWRYKNCCLGAF